MMTSKDLLKQLGEKLRTSNPEHQARLREQLAERAVVETVPANFGLWKQWLTLGTGAAVMLAIVIAVQTQPQPEVAYDYPPGSMTEDQVFASSSGLSQGTGLIGRIADDFEDKVSDFDLTFGSDSVALYSAGPAPDQTTSGEVVDYENEHGSMLEKTTTIGIMTKEQDAVGKVESLFTSFGGHLSGISNYGLGQPSTLTGVVPADSYFMFREQIHELVPADRYIYESLNAEDLIPNAITIDETITDLTKTRDDIKKSLDNTNDANKKAYLQRQLDNVEIQLKDLNDSRTDLDDRAGYVNVAVTVYDLPSFWNVTDQYELQRRIAGFEAPGYLEQIWANMLAIGFWVLQVFSVTFWLIIPLVIWFLARRRQRRMWRELE